jgi:intracellular septation protein A
VAGVAGILVIVAGIIAIDVPYLLRKKLKKELWIFSIILLFGTALSVAQALNIKVPNPLDWVTAIYKPLSDMIEKVLK